ncbi:MAG: hypothetical protein ACREVW_01130 [Burkholderiales bacterium]
MEMTRRDFLRTLASSLAIVAVPAIGIKLPGSEPVEWVVEKFSYDMSLGVSGMWPNGWRNAVIFDDYFSSEMRETEAVEHCKQALRQWYADKFLKAA